MYWSAVICIAILLENWFCLNHTEIPVLIL